MTKNHRIYRGLFLSAVMLCLLIGCSADKTATENTEYETAEAKTQSFSQEPEPYKKQTYRQVLEDIFYNLKFPEDSYTPEDNYKKINDITKNRFAIYDVDNDGNEELIVIFDQSYVAKQTALVYGHTDEGTIINKLKTTSGLTFYKAGIAEAAESNNQSRSADFWPYAMYTYNKEAKSYKMTYRLEALDKEAADIIADTDNKEYNEPCLTYPYEIDKSNSGLVVYITPENSDEAAKAVDYQEYIKWHSTYTGGEQPIDLTFFNLTEENIKNVTS